jgi:hypothetical protein
MMMDANNKIMNRESEGCENRCEQGSRTQEFDETSVDGYHF